MNDQDILARARTIIDQCPNSVLISMDQNGFPQPRTLWTACVDDAFATYYVTGRNMAKCRQISANPKVCTFWSQAEDNSIGGSYVLIKGEARISDDQELRDRFWSDDFKKYFDQGKTDPNYVVIIVTPRELMLMDSEKYPLDRVTF